MLISLFNLPHGLVLRGSSGRSHYVEKLKKVACECYEAVNTHYEKSLAPRHQSTSIRQMRFRRNAEYLQAGQRVFRLTTDEQGIVIAANGKSKIKVKWDGGRTSYFHRGQLPMCPRVKGVNVRHAAARRRKTRSASLPARSAADMLAKHSVDWRTGFL
jgi:hypothetical protein